MIDTPVESACFDRFTVTVSTERVGWWIEQRFHQRTSLGEPRGMQTPATRPHARVLTHSLTLGESDRSPPVESACFDRFAVTVSTERVGWWIEQRFHHRASLGEPRGMQTPTPHPQTCVWKLCARPDLWPAVCADPDVTDVTRSHRVSGESWVAIDGGVP